MGRENSLKNLKSGKDPDHYKFTKQDCQKGQKSSVAVRNHKKQMRQILEEFLDLPCKKGKIQEISPDSIFSEIRTKNLTVQEKMLAQVVQKALQGDLSALIFIRDIIGQKPVEKISQEIKTSNPFEDLSTEELRKLIDDEDPE